MKIKKLPWAVLLLGVIGFFDSLYLTISHFTSNSVICDGTNECDLVLTSSYSTLFGIPVAIFGFIFYAYIIIMASMMIEKAKDGKTINSKFLSPVAFLGFLASVWFLYLQAFVINAYCTYCLLSASIATLIFVLAVINCWKNKNSSALDSQSA